MSTTQSCPPTDTEAIARVLLVEDDEASGRALRRLLEVAGFAVRWVADCNRALEEFRDTPPDVVITDVELGTEDGCDLAQELRESRGFKGTIVGVSGHCDPESTQKMLRAGMDARFSKPLDYSALREYLKSL